MYNTLRATYEPALPALAVVMAAEVGRPQAYRELAEAIAAGDPEAAKKAAIDLLEPATAAMLAVITDLEELLDHHHRAPDAQGIHPARCGREFWKHPSPWIIGAMLVSALTARVVVGDWQLSDALVPVVMLALFPFFEWVVHVFVLHWRPKTVGRLTIDPLLAREHRRHHVDPRDIPTIFIPWKALLWAAPLAVGTALLAFPQLGLGLTFLVFLMCWASVTSGRTT